MKNKSIDISVILPIYNVEEYLTDCLESLLHQGNVNIEVIMIDDGSLDDSGNIARRYAEKNNFFHYYKIENGGLGHARNNAIQYATGKYIAFVDSDDIVVDRTYEKMFMLAEKNRSDLTICNVARIKEKKITESALHKKIFTNVLRETHISKDSKLLYDTTSWNKLILREFYIKNSFKFPERILYEDIPVSIQMHFAANKVSVLNSAGYLWRIRDGVSKSITQHSSNLDNLRDRIRVLEILDDFFDKNVSNRELHRMKQIKYLEIDLMIFINECISVSHEQALQMVKIINEYIRKSIDIDLINELSVINQQKYDYVINENISALKDVCRYQNEQYYNAPVEEKDGELFVELPDDLFIIKSRNITKELVHMQPRKYINELSVKNNGIIEISAHIYRRRINILDCTEQLIEAALFDELTGTIIPIDVFPEKKIDLTQRMGKVMDHGSGRIMYYNYDGANFRILIDLNKLHFSEEQTGFYKLLVRYKNRFSEGSIFLGGCNDTSQDITTVSCDNGIVAKVNFTCNGELQMYIKTQDVFLETVFLDGVDIHCVLTDFSSAVWMRAENTDDKVYFHTKDQKDFYIEKDCFKDELKYHVYVEKSWKVSPLFCNSRNISLYENKNFVVIGSSVGTSELSLQLRGHVLWMQEISRKKKRVVMHVGIAGKADWVPDQSLAKLCVEDSLSKKQIVLAECKYKSIAEQVQYIFSIDFNDGNIIKNFYQSLRDVYIEYFSDADHPIREALYSPQYFNEVILFETLKIRIYRKGEGTVRIGLSQLWKKEEDSQEKRDILIYKNYSEYRKERIHTKRIIFESMWGSKYSCNPQALYEYIDKNYPEYECIWSLDDARIPIKGHGKRVRRGSQEYYHYLATAKYFVNNVNFESGYVKREGQIEIQTMHGTPLKTLGLDVKGDFQTEESKEQYVKKNKRWNYLIVQGKFVEQRANTMFGFDEKILSVGYPRTDRLFCSTLEQKQRVKEMIGIPLDKKVIFYAPTWRVKKRFEMHMNLEQMKKYLSQEYVIIIRLHHFSIGGYDIPADGKFVFDMNEYQYVEDLYNISDILITDYSSVMFDYALLDKPMIFFVYDIEEYAEQLRGMYVDFKEEAPGALVYDTDEIISVIKNIDNENKRYCKKIEQFKEKFLTYENGNSCEKIMEEVFRPRKFSFMRLVRKKLYLNP